MNNQSSSNNALSNHLHTLRIASIIIQILIIVLILCPIVTLFFIGDVNLFELFLDEEVDLPIIVPIMLAMSGIGIISGTLMVIFPTHLKGYQKSYYKKSNYILSFISNLCITGFLLYLWSLFIDSDGFAKFNTMGFLLIFACIISTVILTVIIFSPKKNENVSSKKNTVPSPAVTPVRPQRNTVILSDRSSLSAYLERGYIFLEDGEWDKAAEYMETVLDNDPKCSEAYLGLLMIDMRVRYREDLKKCEFPFDANINYEKILKFGNEDIITELAGYIDIIKASIEESLLEDNYSAGVNLMSSATSEKSYLSAIHFFEKIKGYKDSDILAQECHNRIKEIRIEQQLKDKLYSEKTEQTRKKIKKAVIIVSSIVCVVIAFVIVLNTVIIPNTKYNDAIALMDAGNIVEAYEALIALNGYKDSVTKANSIYDKYRLEMLKRANVGDYVFFGTYEQDNNTSNGKEDIEWLVLEVKDGKALAISKYAIDCKQYNTSYTDVTWETCSLRKWLNNDFINTAFSDDEKAMIPTVTTSVDGKNEYSTNPGNETQDQIFLLSISEADKYFTSDTARQCKPTDYAVAEGAYVNSDNGNCLWWLRSPGKNLDLAATRILYDGSVFEYGYVVNYTDGAVRPALWIDLSE